jgi:hypothetical protein
MKYEVVLTKRAEGQLLYGLGKRKTHRALFAVHEQRVVVHAIRHLSQLDVTIDDI